MTRFARDAVRGAGLLAPVKRVLTHFNFRMTGNAYGHRIVVPSIQGMRCDATEPFMVAVLEQALAGRPGTVIDVGVNLGQTLVKLKGVDPTRAYVGFEPNPSCVHYVGELIRANGYQDCRVLPVGLFSRDDVLELLMLSDIASDAAASLVEGLRPASSVKRVIHVPVVRYQTIARYLDSKVALIKIDVEGAELDVLRTLEPVIERDRPVVLVEVLPGPFVEKQVAIEKMLASWGYDIDLVLKDGRRHFVGLQRMQAFEVGDDLNRCDYVLTPRSP